MVINATVAPQEEALLGKIATEAVLIGKITPLIITLTGNVSIPTGYEHYEGDYEITPKIKKQTLETKNKLMYSDLTIKEIPYYEVSNDYGGITIIIGEE